MKFFKLTILFALFLVPLCRAQQNQPNIPNEETARKVLHSVTETDLRAWMTHLTSEECGGRLTGSPGFYRAADYAADLFKKWGLTPAGDNGEYFQFFDYAYTEVKEGGYFTLRFPVGKDQVSKSYEYPKDYMPGGTSSSGEVKGLDLVYIGFGITAPDLGYDDYKGVDVKGKIVVCEPGTPYSGNDPDMQRKWLPYLNSPYKMANAQKHGAAAVIQVSTKGTVSAGRHEGLLIAGVSENVVNDMFAGTGKNYAETKAAIVKDMKPRSFALNKKADLKAVTEYHPEGKGCNIVGTIKGSDPKLASEAIVVGAHIDHIGCIPVMVSGALDNASGTIVAMGTAKALSESGFQPKRTIIFILFGGEENGLLGSEYFVKHPCVPLSDIKVMFNIDMIGLGYGLGAAAMVQDGSMVETVGKANDVYVKRLFEKGIGGTEVINPRTDGMMFSMYGVPSVGIFSFGHQGRIPYHQPDDVPDIINFDVVDDAVKLIASSILLMDNAPELKAHSIDQSK